LAKLLAVKAEVIEDEKDKGRWRGQIE